MGKHAYLIMAHHEFSLLKKLILLLDDPKNDLYLHVDKKAKLFTQNDFNNITRYSELKLIRRNDVTWGGYSQINCELRLLEAAVKGDYDYYHLLSGVDLPLERQDVIHDYFTNHAGCEFLYIQHGAMLKYSFMSRIRYFHFLQELIGKKRGSTPLLLLNRLLIKSQQMMGMDRNKRWRFDYQKGTTWFSITHHFAGYVLSQESFIRKRYRFTKCADEIFLHTLAWNSEFKANVIEDSLRMIDWKRGRPYTFRSEDFDHLINSGKFWARKFSERVDRRIIEKIFNQLFV